MKTKLSKVQDAMRAGNWAKALSIAAKFPRLGAEKKAIEGAHDALRSPAFYRQIGKDPDTMVAEGIAALKTKYAI